MISDHRPRQRLLIFIVAYNAESFIQQVIYRIPPDLGEYLDVEILIIDDASHDQTFESALEVKTVGELPFRLRVLVNPINQGYGGNQKLGNWYAIQKKFDFVALLHGDGQYAPEFLPELIKPLMSGEAEAVIGSRMLTPKAALQGGMPLHKYIGNRILTWYQNKLIGTTLSEYHSGYRIYSTQALSNIPFELNTNDFHFDTEILIQLHLAGYRIKELPIPTYYGDEICHVNGIRYAIDVFSTTTKARAQELNIYYERKYDCTSPHWPISHYKAKLNFHSPHWLVLNLVKPKSRVLDLGCAGGYLGQALQEKKDCYVTGVDLYPPSEEASSDRFIIHDLDEGLPDIDYADFDYILVLDVIEHLKSPESFALELRSVANPKTKIIISTGNVGFILTRLSLLLGNFNYGKRGILDLTHKRLFTFGSITSLFEQANYEILTVKGTPVPFPLIFGDGRFSHSLLWLNRMLIQLRKSLFAFQSFLVLQSRPTLSHLMDETRIYSDLRQKTLHSTFEEPIDQI
ncbi:MAG: bifunctional glycosyltransferase/class I SAM-dependent methyltransferase [Candidatus Promineifilaceae bacterium]